MALKDWKQERITHQPKPMGVSWKIGIWNKDKEKIEVNKIGKNYEYIRNYYGISQAYKTFKTKTEAVNYAKSYMRSH